MSPFAHVDELEVLKIWNGVHGRAVSGAEASLTWIELDPNVVVPEHHHPNEQTGILVRGSLTFRIGDETQELRPGSMWVIPGDVPLQILGGVWKNTDPGDVRADKLAAKLETLGPGNWLMIDHAAIDSPETRAISHPGYEFVAADRSAVLAAWTSPKVMEVVKRRGIVLTSRRDLTKH